MLFTNVASRAMHANRLRRTLVFNTQIIVSLLSAALHWMTGECSRMHARCPRDRHVYMIKTRGIAIAPRFRRHQPYDNKVKKRRVAHVVTLRRKLLERVMQSLELGVLHGGHPWCVLGSSKQGPGYDRWFVVSWVLSQVPPQKNIETPVWLETPLFWATRTTIHQMFCETSETQPCLP